MAERTPQHGDDPALRTLLALVDRAIDLQDRADAVLFACATADEPGARIAREGGLVAAEYNRLWEWARESAPDADPASVEGRAVALLMAHCNTVHVAVRFAFPRTRTARSEEQRRAVTRLGSVAGRLRDVREELRMWVVVAGDAPLDGG
jgi:hypothetical protein